MGRSQGSPGFVEHDRIRIVEVTGSDARGWLNDLVTGPIEALGREEATRSLLLTPTGRIRADFTVADLGTLTLLQDPDQPDAVDALLAPYVLSSDVELSDVTERLALFSIPGAEGTPVVSDGIEAFAPSILGPGVGLIVDRARASGVARSLSSSLPRADADALERWRVEAAIPVYGADFDAGALPAEAALESAIDFTKGCFLGQESVAKVRNLGHPQTTLVALRGAADIVRGDGVYADGTEVGTITSAAVADGGTILLARVRWDVAREELSLGNGTPFERRSVNGTETQT
jgi:tRNA-modifying protein YgfZ